MIAGWAGSKVPLINSSIERQSDSRYELFLFGFLPFLLLLSVRACEGGRTRDDDAAAMEVRAILLPRPSAPLLLRPGLSSPRRVRVPLHRDVRSHV